MLCPHARCDEQGHRLPVDIGRVPSPGRVDRIIPNGGRDGYGGAVDKFLMKRHGPCNTQHGFGTGGMRPSGVPSLGELVKAHQPPFCADGRRSRAVIGTPCHVGKRGLSLSSRAKPEVDGIAKIMMALLLSALTSRRIFPQARQGRRLPFADRVRPAPWRDTHSASHARPGSADRP